MHSDEFAIRGRILGHDGVGIPHLEVDVFDRDLIFYEELGKATTDEHGRFEVRYVQSFLESLFEGELELLLEVRDDEGESIIRVDEGHRCRKGSDVEFHVTLPEPLSRRYREKLRPSEKLRPLVPARLEPLFDAERLRTLLDAAGLAEGHTFERVAVLCERVPAFFLSIDVMEDARATLEGDVTSATRLRQLFFAAEDAAPEAERLTQEQLDSWDEESANALVARLDRAEKSASPTPLLVSDDALHLLIAAISHGVAADQQEALRFYSVLLNGLWRLERLAPLQEQVLSALSGDEKALRRFALNARVLEPGRSMFMPTQQLYSGGAPMGFNAADFNARFEFERDRLPGKIGPWTPPDDLGKSTPSGRPGRIGWEPGDDICPFPFPFPTGPKLPPTGEWLRLWRCIARHVNNKATVDGYEIRQITPARACPLTEIQLDGTHFSGTGQVVFPCPTGTTLARANVWTSERIKVTVPEDAISGTVSLKIPGDGIAVCGRYSATSRQGTGHYFDGGQAYVTKAVLSAGKPFVQPGDTVRLSWESTNADSVWIRIDGASSRLDTYGNDFFWKFDLPTSGSLEFQVPQVPPFTDEAQFLVAQVTAEGSCGKNARTTEPLYCHYPYDFTIDGIEVTQGIQYYHAAQHLTSNQARDNSLPLIDGKLTFVRAYLRSGLSSETYNRGELRDITGTLRVERWNGSQFVKVGDHDPLRTPNERPVVAKRGFRAVSDPANPTSLMSALEVERIDLQSSLLFSVPPDQITGRVRFRVEAWSPDDGSGKHDKKSTDAFDTVSRKLQVKFIAFAYTDPATSSTLQPVEPADAITQLRLVLRMFPVQASAGAAFVLGGPLTLALGDSENEGGWGQAKRRVSETFYADLALDPGNGAFLYYGILPVNMPNSGSWAGFAFGIGAMGLASAGHALPHELGHLLGLSHAPVGNPGDPDPYYPGYLPYLSASIGEFGFFEDLGTPPHRHVMTPRKTYDFMGYGSDMKWISPYHWSLLLLRPWLLTESQPPGTIPGGVHAAMGPGGAQSPGSQSHYLAGSLDADRLEVTALALAPTGAVPGTRELRSFETDLVAEVLTRDGRVLDVLPVSAEPFCHAHDAAAQGALARGGNFNIELLASPEDAEVRIRRGNEVLWSRRKNDHTIELSALHVQLEKDHLHISWTVQTKRAPHSVCVLYSQDGGVSWQTVATGIVDSEVFVPRSFVMADVVRLKVVSNDGFHIDEAQSEEIVLPPRPAGVVILGPDSEDPLLEGQLVRLWGSVYDEGSTPQDPAQALWLLDGKEVARGLHAVLPSIEAGKHRLELHLGQGSNAIHVEVTEAQPSK